jgi:nitrogen regulatory protein P-II 1
MRCIDIIYQMKRLDIIIPPEHLRDLDKLLHKHKVGGMSFHDVKGRGRTQSEPVSVGYSRVTYVPEFGYRTKIELVVSDLLAENIINDILEILGTGGGIIGKIFVSNVAEAYDIRSSEKDDAAL